MEHTDLSVILAVNGPMTMLPVAIAHLDMQSYPSARYEVVIVQYGPHRERGDLLERFATGSPMRTRCVQAHTANRAGALNRALDAASGQWVLFLDEDLLAGSHLVEQHVTAQERRGGRAAIVGAIERHPQSYEVSYSRWSPPIHAPEWGASRPLNALHWRMFNLSVPRQDVLDAGGFDETFNPDGLIDLDLAWRLARAGLMGYYQRSAAAYAFRGLDFATELRRAYGEGYSLVRLAERAESHDVIKQLLWRGGRRAAELTSPVHLLCAEFLCRWMGPHTGVFARLFPHVLRRRQRQGFRDAQAGRPPRQFEETPTPDDAVLTRMQTLH